MRANRAPAQLRAGRVAAGPFLAYGSPDLAEHVAHLGFDSVALDWQLGQ